MKTLALTVGLLRRAQKQFLLVLLIASLFGCGKKVIKDGKELNSFLSRVPPLSIQLIMVTKTNDQTIAVDFMTSKKMVAALNETNRLIIDNSERRVVTGCIELYDGTNFITRVNIFEDGVLEYVDYYFILKSPFPK